VTVDDVTVTDIKMGETVTAGAYRWERIEGITVDYREEPHFDPSFNCNMFHSKATEVEVFRAFMPLDRQTLLNIINRANANDENMFLLANTRSRLGTIKGALTVNKPAANIVLRGNKKRRRREFHLLHVLLQLS
jgi:hypothetical protein